MTGRPPVQSLLKRGHTVRVLAHNEDERSMRLQEFGAEVVIGGGRLVALLRERMRRHGLVCDDACANLCHVLGRRGHRASGLVVCDDSMTKPFCSAKTR